MSLQETTIPQKHQHVVPTLQQGRAILYAKNRVIYESDVQPMHLGLGLGVGLRKGFIYFLEAETPTEKKKNVKHEEGAAARACCLFSRACHSHRLRASFWDTEHRAGPADCPSPLFATLPQSLDTQRSLECNKLAKARVVGAVDNVFGWVLPTHILSGKEVLEKIPRQHHHQGHGQWAVARRYLETPDLISCSAASYSCGLTAAAFVKCDGEASDAIEYRLDSTLRKKKRKNE